MPVTRHSGRRSAEVPGCLGGPADSCLGDRACQAVGVNLFGMTAELRLAERPPILV